MLQCKTLPHKTKGTKLKGKSGAGEMAQAVRASTHKPGDLISVSRMHMVDGGDRISQVVLCDMT